MDVANVLDRLLATLDTRLHAFALCEVQRGFRLVFDPMGMVVIHYVLVGTGSLQVGDGKVLPFGPHSILVVPPRQRQRLSASEGETKDIRAEENCSPLPDRLVRFGAETGGGDLLVLFDTLSEPIVEDVSAVEHLRSAFQLMLVELSRPMIGTRALTEALMKQCLVILLRQHFMRGSISSPLFAALQDQRLTHAVASIIEHPGGRHSLQGLAAIAGMSRSSFTARFGEVFGQSALDFVSKVRLRHAAYLLITTDLPIKVVASSVGYASRSHFSSAFSAAYGVNPTSYRSINAFQESPSPAPDATPQDAER